MFEKTLARNYKSKDLPELTTENLVRHWTCQNNALFLYDLGHDKWNWQKLGYKFFWKHPTQGRILLFYGDDFYPSMLHSCSSLETVYALLEFLTLQRGDTDSDYFDNYTPYQLNWIDSSDCEDLQYFALMQEEKLAEK